MHVESGSSAALVTELQRRSVPIGQAQWAAIIGALHSVLGPNRLRRNLSKALSSVLKQQRDANKAPTASGVGAHGTVIPGLVPLQPATHPSPHGHNLQQPATVAIATTASSMSSNNAMPLAPSRLRPCGSLLSSETAAAASGASASAEAAVPLDGSSSLGLAPNRERGVTWRLPRLGACVPEDSEASGFHGGGSAANVAQHAPRGGPLRLQALPQLTPSAPLGLTRQHSANAMDAIEATQVNWKLAGSRRLGASASMPTILRLRPPPRAALVPLG